MEMEEICQGTCPTIEEINDAISKMSALFECDKLNKIISALYLKYVNNSLYQQPTEMVQVFKPKQIIKFKDQIQQILTFQKKIASQAFIRKGYGIIILQQEIGKRGGLFEITQKRYKNDAVSIVIQAFSLATEYFAKCFGKMGANPCEKQIVCLQSILLNCRKYFSREQVITFLKFVALLFQENCNEFTLEKRQLFSFYNNARQLAKFKQQNGRNAFKQRHSPASNNINPQLYKRNQHQTRLLHIYSQVLSYAATRERYQIHYGDHHQFNNVRDIQNVISKVIRKTIKDIEQCHKKKFSILPQLTSLRQAKIKEILTNSDASTLRGQLITFELVQRKNIEKDVSFQLSKVSQVRLSEVIMALNAYHQNFEENNCI